jgi:hypothetical protein
MSLSHLHCFGTSSVSLAVFSSPHRVIMLCLFHKLTTHYLIIYQLYRFHVLIALSFLSFLLSLSNNIPSLVLSSKLSLMLSSSFIVAPVRPPPFNVTSVLVVGPPVQREVGAGLHVLQLQPPSQPLPLHPEHRGHKGSVSAGTIKGWLMRAKSINREL